jgi:hypothetical protein
MADMIQMEFYEGKKEYTYWVVAEIGPDGLDREIWTKSGSSLDCVWTVFSKMVAEITMVCRVKVHKKDT